MCGSLPVSKTSHTMCAIQYGWSETNTNSTLIINDCKTFCIFCVCEMYLQDCMPSADKSKLNCFCPLLQCRLFEAESYLLMFVVAAHWIVAEGNSMDALIETSEHSIFACSSFQHTTFFTTLSQWCSSTGVSSHTEMRECTYAHAHSKENATTNSYSFLRGFFPSQFCTQNTCAQLCNSFANASKYTQLLFLSISLSLSLSGAVHLALV